MKKLLRAVLLGALMLPMMVTFSACTESEPAEYEQITQSHAKSIMDNAKDYVLIDARTQEEFDQGHIKGAVMIPEYEIKDRAKDEIPQKDALILVYCRTGRRSKIAAQALADMGYTNVKEFGGIVDWIYGIER